jgi:hypothetical protein
LPLWLTTIDTQRTNRPNCSSSGLERRRYRRYTLGSPYECITGRSNTSCCRSLRLMDPASQIRDELVGMLQNCFTLENTT